MRDEISKPLTIDDLYHALDMAERAHRGQKDLGGKYYIFHPSRVMIMCAGFPAKIVGILHDVVEDTAVSLCDIEQFGPTVTAAVDAITKRDNETYREYLKRCSENRLAAYVKVRDLQDNMSPDRKLPNSDTDYYLKCKHRKALKFLLELYPDIDK